MEEQAIKSKKSSQKDSQIKVDWHYAEEVPPAFKRLMMLLLRDRSEKSGVEKKDKLT